MKLAWQQPLLEIARQAGDAIMAYYQNDGTKTWIKADDSPLTQADLAAHNVIVDGLALLTPDIPVLSEESTEISWQERQPWQQYWLVDPLDGTKEFIKQNGEFTVNIALIEANKPVMSVVYAPALKKLYYANIEQGCFLLEPGQEQIKLSLDVNAQVELPIRVVGSRSHPSEEMAQFSGQFEQVDVIPTGSSLKLCLVAQGLADIYPRLGPTMEWDTAAGQCIAQCAGAKVTQLDGAPLLYNAKQSLKNTYFVVSHPALSWQGNVN
ncbi:MAG: 3'(2'),5'-bisphosphate nucleotidase CysQ [Gammaproteobacteria bacterium]|nr:3'(2'),5'-bisphosphate nucleotidase CysQ [Gammaproteobacteria bacterium]